MADTILIVDDEPEIGELLEIYLKGEGFLPLRCGTAAQALELIRSRDISLALLDVMLPDLDGFTLCRTIRQDYLFPIIMLTARVESADKLTGLALGADDYITKPFHPLEVVARVKTQLRRCRVYDEARPREPLCYESGGLTLCPDSRKCTLRGEEIALTPLEFDILLCLFQNQGKVVSSEALFEAVWKESYLDSNNTVMAHIARLRGKLHEPPRKPKLIKTVWGVGYTIE